MIKINPVKLPINRAKSYEKNDSVEEKHVSLMINAVYII